MTKIWKLLSAAACLLAAPANAVTTVTVSSEGDWSGKTLLIQGVGIRNPTINIFAIKDARPGGTIHFGGYDSPSVGKVGMNGTFDLVNPYQQTTGRYGYYYLPVRVYIGAKLSTFTIDRYSLEGLAAPAVPEPATWALMILGFGAVGGAMRRRTRGIAIA